MRILQAAIAAAAAAWCAACLKPAEDNSAAERRPAASTPAALEPRVAALSNRWLFESKDDKGAVLSRMEISLMDAEAPRGMEDELGKAFGLILEPRKYILQAVETEVQAGDEAVASVWLWTETEEPGLRLVLESARHAGSPAQSTRIAIDALGPQPRKFEARHRFTSGYESVRLLIGNESDRPVFLFLADPTLTVIPAGSLAGGDSAQAEE
ncbi:MAG: hypothetical protein BWZ10_01177 [candidate division BRC1 bacterium ADurb.BinA364]|nr:MAG: hypothetical protein BWZ10_01177 [candidate division BRC1 bacterium ADurb.BinA364]